MKKIVTAALLFIVASCSGADTGVTVPEKQELEKATLVLYGYKESSTVSIPLSHPEKWREVLFQKEIGETPEWNPAGKVVFNKKDESIEALLDPQYYVVQKSLPEDTRRGFISTPELGDMLVESVLGTIAASPDDSKEAITGGRFLVYYFMYNRGSTEQALKGVRVLKKALEREGLTEEKRKEATHMIDLFEFNESKR